MKYIVLIFSFFFLACTKESYNPNVNQDRVETYDDRDESNSKSPIKFTVEDFKKKAESTEWLKTQEAIKMADYWSQLTLKDIKENRSNNSHNLIEFEKYFLIDCKFDVKKCNLSRLQLIKGNIYAVDILTFLSLNSPTEVAKNYFKVTLDLFDKATSEYFIDSYFYQLNSELLKNDNNDFYLKYCESILALPANIKKSENFNKILKNTKIESPQYKKLKKYCGRKWHDIAIEKLQGNLEFLKKHFVKIKNINRLKKANKALALNLDFDIIEVDVAQIADMFYERKINKEAFANLLSGLKNESILNSLKKYARLKFFDLTFETLTFVHSKLQAKEFKDPNETMKKLSYEMDGLNLRVWDHFFKFINHLSDISDEFETNKITKSEVQNFKTEMQSYQKLVKYYAVYPSTYIALHYLSHIRFELVFETLFYVFRFNPQKLFSMILNREIEPFFSLGNDRIPLQKSEALGTLIFTLKSLPLFIDHGELATLVDSTLGLYLKEVYGRGEQNKIFIEKAIDQTTFSGGNIGPGYSRSELDYLFKVCEEERMVREDVNYKRTLKRDFYIPDFYSHTHFGVNVNKRTVGRKSISRMAVNILANRNLGGDKFHEFSEYFRTTVIFRVQIVKEIKEKVMAAFSKLGVHSSVSTQTFNKIDSDLNLIASYQKYFIEGFAEKKEIFKKCGYDILANEWNRQYKLIDYEIEYLKDVHYYMYLQKHIHRQDLAKTPGEVKEKYKNIDFSKLSMNKRISIQMNDLLFFKIEEVPQVNSDVIITSSYFSYSNTDLLARHMHFLKHGYKHLPALDPSIHFYYNGTLEDGNLFDKYHKVHVRSLPLDNFIIESLKLSFNPSNEMVKWFDGKLNNLSVYAEAFYDAVSAHKLAPNVLSAEEVVDYYVGFWDAVQVDARHKDVMQKIGISSHYVGDLPSLTKNEKQDGPTELFRPLLKYAIMDVDDSLVSSESSSEPTSVTIKYFRPLDEALQFYRELQLINDNAYDIKLDMTNLAKVYNELLIRSISGSYAIIDAIDRYNGPLEYWYKVNEPPTPRGIKYPENTKTEFINRILNFTDDTKNFFKTKKIVP